MSKKQKYVLIGVSIFSFFAMIFLSKNQSCQVSDFHYKSPRVTHASGFSKDSACEKAMTTCQAYSSFPEKCRIKE